MKVIVLFNLFYVHKLIQIWSRYQIIFFLKFKYDSKTTFFKFQGYYMHKDVFGSSGDFITSPEISQMFGEVIFPLFLNNQA